ncbi:ABC transporter permease [Treponema socranskii]|uniref:ABC transporter permease n=1 Tax=Treponema socranskii TaxID=53419 RepID=UPI002870DD65|nr:ABC transporter permease [Treponema socranskii]MDR9859049.1 ABC transporter permease [Treponema socranskii]
MRTVRNGYDKNLGALLFVTLIVLILCGFLFGQSMYSARNIQSMAYQIPEFGFVALGMMLAFMIGGIDLSIIANANLSGILAASILTGKYLQVIPESQKIVCAVIVIFTVSTLLGCFNGFLVSKFGVPSIIATLSTMTLYSGIGTALTGGKSIVGFPERFTAIGLMEIFGIPVIFIFFIGTALCLGIIIAFTRFGRKLYLYGENPTAALFSGINNARISFWTFTIIGLLAGCASITIISRVNSAKVGYGEAYSLSSLIVCVIGGIHPAGGKGKVLGVVTAVILMQILFSAFTIMQLSPFATKLIWGVMLIFVMGIAQENKRLLKVLKKINIRRYK